MALKIEGIHISGNPGSPMISLGGNIGEQHFHFWLDTRANRDPFDPIMPRDGIIHCNTPNGERAANGRALHKHTERRTTSQFGKTFIAQCSAAALAENGKMISEWREAHAKRETEAQAERNREYAEDLKKRAGPRLYDALKQVSALINSRQPVDGLTLGMIDAALNVAENGESD